MLLSIGTLIALYSQTSSGGVLSVTLSSGLSPDSAGSWIGDVLTVVSSISGALYQVLFKYKVGDANGATGETHMNTTEIHSECVLDYSWYPQFGTIMASIFGIGSIEAGGPLIE